MRHFFSVIQTPSGTAVSGASIDVYNAGGTVHATIYSDDGVTTTANPITSASDGTFGFYVADGRYDLKVSGTGITTRTFSDVEIFDATEKNAGDGTLTALVATFQNLEQTRYADQFSGSDMGAKIAAAIADLPSTGGIVDATAFQGVQSAAATININKPCILKLGGVTLQLAGSPGINLSSTGSGVIGLGPGASTLQANTGTNDVIQSNAINVMAKGFTINSAVARTSGAGIRCKGGNGVYEDFTIDKTFNGIQITDSLSGASGNNIFKRIVMGSLASPAGTWNTGILLGNVASGTVTGEFFQDVNVLGTSAFADAMVVLDSGCDTIHFTDCQFAQSGTDSFCLSIRNTNTSNAPQWNKFTNCVFEAGPTKTGVTVSAGILTNFINCTLATCGVFFQFNGGNSVHVVGCKMVGCQQQAVNITAGTDIKLIGNRIADSSLQTNGGFNAIQISANVTDFSLISNDFTTVLSSANQPFNNISIAAGTSDRYVISHNKFLNTTGGGLTDNGTGLDKLIAFNSPTSSSTKVLNGIRYADQFSSIAAAYADLPSTGGTVIVPPNYTETVGSSWTLSKAYSSIVFTGPATLNFGANTITVPVGVHGVTIESWVPWGSFVIVAGTGVEFNYTGAGTLLTVGASSADTYGFRLKDICIFINNAGSAAVGTKLVRCPIYELKSLKIIGPGGAITQQAIILDGTGNYTGGVIYAPMISGCFKGIQFTGSGVNAANANQVIGGLITSPASGTSLGLDFQAGSAGNSVYGTDVEQHAVGYNFGGTSQGNVVFGRSETNTSGCTLGASTLQNEIHLINTTDPFTDSGTNNLIYTLGGTTHGATLTQANSSNNTTLLNFQDVVGPITGNSSDQTVYTYTLPGGTMAKGKGIRVKVWWVHGTGTASITYKLSFGASAIVNSASAVTGNGYAEAVIMNTTGSTSSQRASSQFIPTGTAPTIVAGVAPSETTASNVVVKFTFNVANTDQLTGAEWVVELIQ